MEAWYCKLGLQSPPVSKNYAKLMTNSELKLPIEFSSAYSYRSILFLHPLMYSIHNLASLLLSMAIWSRFLFYWFEDFFSSWASVSCVELTEFFNISIWCSMESFFWGTKVFTIVSRTTILWAWSCANLSSSSLPISWQAYSMISIFLYQSSNWYETWFAQE